MTGRLHVQNLPLTRLLPTLESTDSLIESPNLAPRRPISAIRLEQGEYRLSSLFWGLTPPWLESIGSRATLRPGRDPCFTRDVSRCL